MLETEMDEHLGYEKNSVAGNNSGNSRNGYGKKTIISDYGSAKLLFRATGTAISSLKSFRADWQNTFIDREIYRSVWIIAIFLVLAFFFIHGKLHEFFQ